MRTLMILVIMAAGAGAILFNNVSMLLLPSVLYFADVIEEKK